MPPLLPRFLEDEKTRREHAQKLAQVAQESDGDVREEKRRHAPSAVDALAARGVPLVGPGCAGGVIRGTNPEAALLAKEPRP